jgi:hypothetical protein
MPKLACLAAALLFLTGCNRDQAVPTAEENRQLDDAANLLDQAPASLENVDDSAVAGDNAGESSTTP